MEEWKEYKYTDLCTLIGGGTPKTSEPSYWGGDIPWLSVKDFGNDEKYVYSTEKTITEAGLNNSSTKLLRRDDIIISARGTIGAIAMLASEMAFNQSCFGIRSNDIVEQHYLYYLTKTKISELQKNSHGSVFDTITRDTFAKIDCVIPSKKIQRQIASILSSLDDKIEANRKINENLEQEAQALFKSWFVDFEPFKNGEFVESELGMIPKGWRVEKIGNLPINVTDYVANGSFASLKENVKLYQTPEYAYFIRNTDLKSGNYEVYVDKHSYEFLSKSTLYGGEVIISNVGDVGSVHLCPYLDKPMTLGNNIIMLKPDKQYYSFFLYILFKWAYGNDLIMSIKGGSAQPKFNKTDFKSLKIIVPNDVVLEKYHSIISSLFNKIRVLDDESRRLAELRDTLLPKLMSGELKVNEIEGNL